MRRKQDYQGAGSVALERVAIVGRPRRGHTVGIGLIGCGGMGRYVAQKGVGQSSRLRIRGLYDPDRRSIEASHKTFGNDIPAYANCRELCAADDIDWVMIASWNCFHKEQVIAAFEAGKHVFCQKPLAINARDCVAMRTALSPAEVQAVMKE